MPCWLVRSAAAFLALGALVLCGGCQLVGLAGEFIDCGPEMCPGVYWVREGGNRKEADADRDACWAHARQQVQPAGFVSHQTMQEKIVPLQEACMKALGYVVTSDPPPGWVRKWGREASPPP